MLYYVIFLVFLVGYVFIVLEHSFKVNKVAPALLTGALIWGLIALNHDSSDHAVYEACMEHISGIAAIILFLLGAMVVVEVMSQHQSFSLITDAIKTTNPGRLMLTVGISTFFLSAVLDNMTTAIVMVAIMKRLLEKNEKLLLLIAGIVIIASNAGGAWSPIGDVTTIMLWMDGQVTMWSVMKSLIIPSLVCLAASMVMVYPKLRNETIGSQDGQMENGSVSNYEKVTFLILGLATLIAGPAFKLLTDLPPFLGIFLGLGVMWIVNQVMHGNHTEERKERMIENIIRTIDTPTILFFFGILLSVSGLEYYGHLGHAAEFLARHMKSDFAVNGLIGVVSAVVDNVPLVAAVQGMYSLDVYPSDSTFWNTLAYAAGTGGSMLVIGSAAGVAVMGMLEKKMTSLWYLRHVSPSAAIGYAAGFVAYYLMC